jgi:hypothetical protein
LREINIGKNYGGVRFLGINQSPSEFSNNKYLFVRLNDGSVLDGSMASAYDEYLKAYYDLCPSSAPKNK